MRKKITLVASLAFAAALCAGVGAANVTAQAETDWTKFQISESAVRLGDGSVNNPTGLRFKVDCPEYLKGAENTECYTVLSFTSSVVTEQNPDGNAVPYQVKVPATNWRTDSTGWNAVLLEIPASDYVTEVTAVSYVEVNGEVVHTSNEATTSIAKTASKVLAGGAVDTQLDAFVANAVSAISLGEQDGQSIEAEVGETVQLTATTTPAGYSVMWSSSDDSVATVDNNGKVTVTGVGKAKINAVMGGAGTVCEIVSTWGEKYGFEGEATVSPLANVNGNTNWEIVTLADNNKVLNVKECTFNGEQYIQNPKFAFNVDYINWIFEEHDYFTWTIYSDVPYIRYLYDNANGSPYQMLYGYNSTNMFYAEGSPVQNGEETLYKFTLSYNRDFWNVMLRNEYNHCMRIAFTGDNVTAAQNIVTPEILYFDDIQMGDYTVDTINFEDGKANAAIQGGTSAGAMAATAVATTAANGNYAVKVDSNTSQNRFVVDSSYLHYVFNELQASSLRFKWYSSDASATTTHSFRVYANSFTASQITAGTQVYVADGGYFLNTLTAAQYHTAFGTDGKLLSGTDINYVGFGIYVSNGSYVKGGYIDDVTPNVTMLDATYFDTRVDTTTVKSDLNSASFLMTGNNCATGFSAGWLKYVFVAKGAESVSFKLTAQGYKIAEFVAHSNHTYTCNILWYNDGSANNYQCHNIDSTPVINEDGTVTLTIKAETYFNYFEADGTPKANTISSQYSVVTIGLRLIANYDSDGNGTMARIANTTYTYSDVTLNFADAE